MNGTFLILYNFVAGTLCLIFGVNSMSSGLENLHPKALERILRKFAGKTTYAFLAGTLITALVQSSTAVTVITVGLVNSGLMNLTQAVGIIYGANLGTTVTAQLMSFKITNAALPVLALSLLLRVISKKAFLKNAAQAAAGFGFMLAGLEILNSSIPYLSESSLIFEAFKKYGSSPIIGLIIGIITTMLVHSSSATVGLTIILFNSGFIDFHTALGLTLGDNIGTCVTAQLASIGTNITARRVAWAHTFYNIIGVAAVLLLFQPFSDLVHFITYLTGGDKTNLVANSHTIFNALSALVFLPVSKHYIRFINWIVRR